MEVTERVISLSDWNLGYVEGKLETFWRRDQFGWLARHPISGEM